MPEINTEEHELCSATAVIQRMKEALRVRSDRDLGRYFNVSARAVSAWRTRNAVPYQECVQLAVKTDTSLNWLLLGKPESGDDLASTHKVDYEILRLVVEAVDKRFAYIYGEQSSKMSRDKALQICGSYRWWSKHLRRLLDTGKFTRAEALLLIEGLASDRDKLGFDTGNRPDNIPT